MEGRRQVGEQGPGTRSIESISTLRAARAFSQSTQQEMTVVIFPFYGWRANRAQSFSSPVPKVTWLVNGEARIWLPTRCFENHHVHLTPPGSPSSGDLQFPGSGSRKRISVNSLNHPHSASYKFIFELSSPSFSHSRLSSPSVHWTPSFSPLMCHSGHLKLSLSADSF